MSCERRGTKALELWAKRATSGYAGANVENMTTSWRNGLAFCALIHSVRPDLIDYSALKAGDILENNSLAFRVAEQHLGIPALLDAEDMLKTEVPDRLSILTYVSQLYQAFASLGLLKYQGNSDHTHGNRDSGGRSACNNQQLDLLSPRKSPGGMTPDVKVSSIGRAQKEVCGVCKLPVFIAERLRVGSPGQLLHRTCFRCARCSAQLTLASYYETEKRQFCCETCPDEEKLFSQRTVHKAVASDTDSDSECSSSSNDCTSGSLDGSLHMQSNNNSIAGLPISRSPSLKPRTIFLSQTLCDDRQLSGVQEKTVGTDIACNPSWSSPFSGVQAVTVADCASVTLDKDIVIDTGQSNYKRHKARPLSESISNKLKIFESQSSLNHYVLPDSRLSQGLSVGNQCRIDSTNRAGVCEESIGELKMETAFPAGVQDSQTSALTSDASLGLATNDPLKCHVECAYDAVSEAAEQHKYLALKSDEAFIRTQQHDSRFVESVCLADPTVRRNSEETGDALVGALEAEKTHSVCSSGKDELSESGSQCSVKSILWNSHGDSKERPSGNQDAVHRTRMDSVGITNSSSDPVISSEKAPASAVDLSHEEPNIIRANSKTPNMPETLSHDISQLSLASNLIQSGTHPEADTSGDPASGGYPHQMNPFGSEDEEGDDVSSQIVRDQAVGSVIKVIRPPVNPFDSGTDDDDDDEGKEGHSIPPKGLNPFWSDEEGEPMARTSWSSRGRAKPPRPPPPTLQRNVNLGGYSEDSSQALFSATPASPTLSCKSSESAAIILKKKQRLAPAPPPPFHVPHVKQGKDDPLNCKLTKDLTNQSRMNERASLHAAVPGPYLTSKSDVGEWKRKKGPAPPRPVPQKRTTRKLPLREIQQELKDIEVKQRELERQGVLLEMTIRDRAESLSSSCPTMSSSQSDSNLETEKTSLTSSIVSYGSGAEVEEMIIQLFELVNEKNELFRRQTELMYMKREQRLEEEHAELEYQIRCLMMKSPSERTEEDLRQEDELIQRLVKVVELRDQVINCLELERLREVQENESIAIHMMKYQERQVDGIDEDSTSLKKKKKKRLKLLKKKKKKKKEDKSEGSFDADKDVDESEYRESRKKKWFSMNSITP